jgi:hypothetical protein
MRAGAAATLLDEMAEDGEAWCRRRERPILVRTAATPFACRSRHCRRTSVSIRRSGSGALDIAASVVIDILPDAIEPSTLATFDKPDCAS